jgi:Ni/Fe-hydrogenase subunit HybB-like protein
MAALMGLALVLLTWRFTHGLGAVTGLSDGYPWGIWIALDVVTGTALATGGYAVAIIVYVLNRGKYHPLIRSALLTSALGYTLGAYSVVIDLGRWWNLWRIPVFFWEWNATSVLLEVALCMMLYTFVLWIEVSPVVLDRWRHQGSTRLRRFAEAVTPRLERAMPWIIALGLLLPTMHQSSLGSLMLIAGAKLHPLWHTPLLPLLFLITCVGMGYAAVTMDALLTGHIFRRDNHRTMIVRLAKVVAALLAGYLVIRHVDLALRGRLPLIFGSGAYSALFVFEMMAFAIAIGLLISPRVHASATWLFRSAGLVIAAGALYRFSTFLFAFNPGPGWSYFPTIPEMLISLGLIAGEVATYLVLIKRFPILAAEPLAHVGAVEPEPAASTPAIA